MGVKKSFILRKKVPLLWLQNKKNEIYYYHHSAFKLFVGVWLQNFVVKLDVSSSRLEIKRNILKNEIYYGKDQ